MNFDFFNVPRIVFGRSAIKRLPEFVPADARAMLVYNGRKPDAVPHAAEFRQRGEPTVDDVDAALAVARAANVDFVLGVGGGSAIDAAKAVAGLLGNGGVATDYMEVVGRGQKITKPAVPWIAIPTTAGTGAEVTRNAVIGWPAKKFKASIRSELLMARVALIDPELHVDVPPHVTASSGADALCQCVEAYVSRGANPMTDAIALKGIELWDIDRVFPDGQDIAAREDMAMAALCGGIALTNAGLGAVHGFAAPLGANFPIPHGTVCGLLLPRVIEANIAALTAAGAAGRPALKKYADIGRASAGDRNNDELSLRTCRYLIEEILGDLHLPSLSHFGMTEADIPPMVDLAKRASSMRYNPVELSDDALAEILRRSL